VAEAEIAGDIATSFSTTVAAEFSGVGASSSSGGACTHTAASKSAMTVDCKQAREDLQALLMDNAHF